MGENGSPPHSSCEWIALTDLPGHSVWSYDGDRGALGYPNMQTIGGSGDLLVGYATKTDRQNAPRAPDFRIARVDTSGTIKSTKRLHGLGWGEEDVWVSLSNGCVAFPSVWDDASGPGGRYGNTGGQGVTTEGMSDVMRVTVICDELA